MDTDQEIKTAVIKKLQKGFSSDVQKLREKLRVTTEIK